jgi:ATP-dependent DNA helicase RecG
MSAESLDLRSPLQYLKGVGPQRAEILNRIGIHKASDLLFYFPRDYQDMTERREIHQLEEGNKVQTIVGTIEEWSRKSTRRGEMLTLVVNCGKGYVKCLWFNMFFVIKEFAKGRKVMLTGKPKFDHPFWVMMHPQITYLADNEEESEVEPFLPIYPLTEGLKQFHLRRIVRNMLPTFTPMLDEVFPEQFLEDHKLLRIDEAVQAIHFPKDHTEKLWALRRFVYQELFVLQLGLAMRRLQHQTLLQASPMQLDASINSRIRQRFPFELTKAQERVIKEIVADMSQPVPMNRLLQGDVGSGKTMIAAAAAYFACKNGSQAVMMAPTDILATQHYEGLSELFEKVGIKVCLLTGSLKAKQKRETLRDIENGGVDFIIGTHAVIQKNIVFKNLSLSITDEQHRFGVNQRALIEGKSVGAGFSRPQNHAAVGCAGGKAPPLQIPTSL